MWAQTVTIVLLGCRNGVMTRNVPGLKLTGSVVTYSNAAVAWEQRDSNGDAWEQSKKTRREHRAPGMGCARVSLQSDLYF